MRWHEKYGQTIDLSIAAIVAVLLVLLFMLLIVAGARAYAVARQRDVPALHMRQTHIRAHRRYCLP